MTHEKAQTVAEARVRSGHPCTICLRPGAPFGDAWKAGESADWTPYVVCEPCARLGADEVGDRVVSRIHRRRPLRPRASRARAG